MKKIIVSLLLVSTLCLFTSIVLYFTGGSFYYLWNLFVCSIISTSIFFSLKLICNDESSLSRIAFYSGLFLNFLFVICILNPEDLKVYAPFLLSIILLFITIGINSHLKNRSDKISFITRIIFWISFILVTSILLLKLTSPIYFRITFIFIVIGSASYIVSSLLLTDIKEK